MKNISYCQYGKQGVEESMEIENSRKIKAPLENCLANHFNEVDN
jgi:hypothetical protein